MTLFIPKNFKAQELVDKATYEKFGESAFRYFRPEILKALDWIHDHYPVSEFMSNGSRIITVNGWAYGGQNQWRGLRLPRCKEYKEWSAHNGAAIDFSANGCTDDNMRKWILEIHEGARMLGQLDHPILGIRRMEIGTQGWVHIDCLEHNEPSIQMVNP